MQREVPGEADPHRRGRGALLRYCCGISHPVPVGNKSFSSIKDGSTWPRLKFKEKLVCSALA